MSLHWKLALAYAWHHPARMLLTSLAMIASACVVVWVVSGYDAIVGQFGSRTTEYLGRYDLFLVPDAVQESYLPGDLVEAIRHDADIVEFEPALQATVRIQADKPLDAVVSDPTDGGKGGSGGGGPGGSGSGGESYYGGRGSGRAPAASGPRLVGTNAAVPPYRLVEGRWLELGDLARREAVIGKSTAEQLQVALGDEVLAIWGTKEYRLKIIGIVAQASSTPTLQRPTSTGRPTTTGADASLGPAASALYVPLPLAQKIAKKDGQVNLVNIKLREGAKAAAFKTRWIARVADANPPVLLVGTQDIAVALEENAMAANARRQAWAATGMSLLAALFIIFTTLSMGIHERIRQFAVMRAVGLTRFQVARVIAAESVVLALIGWAGGLAAGWGLLAILSLAKPTLFASGASLGAWCVILTGLSAFGGALVASVLPAWQAMSVEPLEAMSPRRSVRPNTRWIASAAAIGLVLIAVNPALVYVLPIADGKRYGIYMAVGCTSMALGFLLLSPMLIAAVEAIFGPAIAWLAGLEPRLLRSQLSSNLWRTLGTTVALTVGLGLYVSMVVWGYSMLEPFKPGDWVPDMMVSLEQGGLPDAEIESVRHIPGVIAEQCLPLAVEQPRLASDITGSQQGNSVTRQDNVIIVGLDPDVAFGGTKPLVGLNFVAGTRDEAIARLKQGRYCIVPDHFLTATGLKLGDRFGLVPRERPEKPVEYAIAGAVSLPGWHWTAKFAGLRRRGGRAAAMVFADYDTVRRDFDLKKTNYLWMNIDKQVDMKRIGAALQPIADRYVDPTQPAGTQGGSAVGSMMFGQSLHVATPEEVSTKILARADDVIWAMCQLPLITLLVTSLGVVNTVMASVRARRWELGVLRALGITRGAMFRMVLAEGLLMGLVACLISLAFGVMAGWCGTGISQYVSFFGGMATPLIIPWGKLALGFAATLGLCLAAALWPAISTGRAEPLRLLQEGRTAM